MISDEIRQKITLLENEISKKIIGQEKLTRDILIALFSGGHILLEGVPGLAKTLCVETLSKVVDLDYKRIQFTPDLLPSDLVGSKVYENNKFSIKKGPIFSNLVLADEINRAPSKVQSALLEAMAEKQVTIGEKTFQLDSPFMVLATQNPLEQAGTYSLPEAQLDRFLLKTIVEYPKRDEELTIMKQYSLEDNVKLEKVFSPSDIITVQQEIEKVTLSDNIFDYIADIVFLTRDTKFIEKYLSVGASPRASISLVKASKTLAYLQGRDFVLPEDVKEMVFPVLRHRIMLSYEQIAEGITTDFVIEKILKHITIK
ncbi:MAG: MoxR family ATPase [Candidatus Gracilibacteria bacterium]|nr:MoxR family ATPase [Candidatus Gracilibacteria bacterium]